MNYQSWDKSREDLTAERSWKAIGKYAQLAQQASLDCNLRAASFYAERAQEHFKQLPEKISYLMEEAIESESLKLAMTCLNCLNNVLYAINCQIKKSNDRVSDYKSQSELNRGEQ